MEAWIITLLSGVFGLAMGTFSLSRRRQHNEYTMLLLRWTEKRVWTWLADRMQAWFTAWHTATIVILAILTLSHVLRFPPEGELSSSVSLSALALCWISAGILLAFYTTAWFVPPFRIALWDEGILRGQYELGWGAFSHFQTRDLRFLLYSAVSPQLVRIVLQPRDQQTFNQIHEILSNHMTQQPPAVLPPLRRPVVFVCAALLITLLPLAAALGLAALLPDWSPLIYTAALFVVAGLGGWLMQQFGLD